MNAISTSHPATPSFSVAGLRRINPGKRFAHENFGIRTKTCAIAGWAARCRAREVGSRTVRREQHRGGVDAEEIPAIELAMIVPGVPLELPMPPGIVLSGPKADLEMDVGPIGTDPLLRIGRPPHRSEALAGPDPLPDLQPGGHRCEMRIQGVDLDPIHDVPYHDVIAVVRKSGLLVHVHHGAIRRHMDRIRGFPASITLDAADVQAFVELSSFGPDAAELATGPRLARRAHEELFIPSARLKQGTIRRRQEKGLGTEARAEDPRDPEPHQSTPGHFWNISSSGVRALSVSLATLPAVFAFSCLFLAACSAFLSGLA